MITLYNHNLEEVGKRLDHYLVSNLDDHSRSQIQSWIRSGSILVNDRSVKTGYSLELNDQILINPPKVEDSAEELIAEQIKLDILFGVGLLVMFIGVGQMIAGYVYPNQPDEITDVVESYEKK